MNLKESNKKILYNLEEQKDLINSFKVSGELLNKLNMRIRQELTIKFQNIFEQKEDIDKATLFIIDNHFEIVEDVYKNVFDTFEYLENKKIYIFENLDYDFIIDKIEVAFPKILNQVKKDFQLKEKIENKDYKKEIEDYIIDIFDYSLNRRDISGSLRAYDTIQCKQKMYELLKVDFSFNEFVDIYNKILRKFKSNYAGNVAIEKRQTQNKVIKNAGIWALLLKWSK